MIYRNKVRLRNFSGLGNSQDCATLWSDCATRIAQLGLLKFKMISTFARISNFNLTWSLHKAKVISKFPPPWIFKLTWSPQNAKIISKFTPRNFKLTWSLHKVKMVSKFPPPWIFKLTWSPKKMLRLYQNSHPGTSN